MDVDWAGSVRAGQTRASRTVCALPVRRASVVYGAVSANEQSGARLHVGRVREKEEEHTYA